MSGPNSPQPPEDLQPGTATDPIVERRLERLGQLMRRVVRSLRVPDDNLELTPTQLVVLCHLEERPMRVGELAVAAGAAQNTISEVVARLTRSGLVWKKRDPGDKRAVVVGLSDQGVSALATRRESAKSAQRTILNALSVEDQQRFVDAFELIANMAEHSKSVATDTKREIRRKK
jgi:DNA-binding MarR family transcriptional regulator